MNDDRSPRPFWFPDARGWIGVGVFLLSVMLLWMMYANPQFRADEFIQTIATLIIGTAFVGGMVAWAYAATKTGGELADRNAEIVRATTQTAPPVTVSPPATITETKVTEIERPSAPAKATPEATPWP